MTGTEVLNQLVVTLLEACERRGCSAHGLLEGLSVTWESLREHRWSRMPWDEFTVLLDHIERSVGGVWQVEQLWCDMLESERQFHLLARLLFNSSHLLLHATERMVRRYYHGIGCRVQKDADDRVRLELAIPTHLRASLAFGYGCHGALRAYPRLLGGEYAAIDADISARRSVFLVTVPACHLDLGRAGELEAAMARVPAVQDSATTADDMLEAIHLAFDHSSQTEIAQAIGGRLVAARELDELAKELVAILEQHFCCRHVILWCRGDQDDGLEAVVSHSADDGRCRVLRHLTVGNREVGRIEVDLPMLETGGPPPLFDAVVPWIAVAIDHCRARGRTARGVDQVDARAGEATSQWRLTPRQADVLKLLVEGATNKDIAGALGTTNRTIEVHVTQLLRKAGADNRATLIARFWGGGSAGRDYQA